MTYMRFAKAAIAFIEQMLQRAQEVQHRTVWGEADVQWEQGGDGKFFVFFIVNTETAQRAKEAIKREGLLCDMDLGQYSKDDSIEEISV